MKVCCDWAISTSPIALPVTSLLPSSSRGGEITVFQFIPWFRGSRWVETAARGMLYTSHNEKGAQKFVPTVTKMQPAPQQNQAALDYNSNTTQETRGQLPRWSNFVSPKLGIRAEHERSFSTNQHTPTASAPCSAAPWRKPSRLFLSLFKMGAKLVTYRKSVFLITRVQITWH